MTSDVGFARDIRPMFREVDVAEMNYYFDLTELADVRVYAEAIYARLDEGTMPCDAPWPADQVERFRQWIDGGTQP